MSDTLSWLEKLYSNSPGYFAVIAFADGKVRAIKWFSTAELNAAERTIIATGKKADVYISVGTHESPQPYPKRGGENTVISIPGWWADIDIGEEGHKPAALPNPPDEDSARSIIEGLPEPSIVLHSGGGLQAFWLFDEPWTFDEPVNKLAAKKASREWHSLLEQRGKELGYHVDTTGNLDRILRVPGTFNHKTGSPRPTIAKTLEGPAYPIREMASYGLSEEQAQDTEDRTDNFPLSWEQILEPHGWSKCRQLDNGTILWTRPGKSCSEGHSATTNPYGIPVMVNFSASEELPSGPGQKLTKLKVFAHLNYNGNLKEAKAAVRKLVKLTTTDFTKIALRFAETRIKWEELWTNVRSEPEWIIPSVLAVGRQVAIYSEAKQGKSLLLLEWCLALAMGRHPFERDKEQKTINILYIDKENSYEDIRIRAKNMGYEGQNIEHLFYYSFPDLAWLDTEEGGIELYALAKYHDVQLVVIDTLSRVVEGEENSNDTYQSFYKYSGVRLKADGISLVRLDHSGKDGSRGMRGASSKKDDIDDVWQLASSDEKTTVTLTRTHTRTHYGEDVLTFSRLDDPLRHEYELIPDDTGMLIKVTEYLEDYGVPVTAGQQEAWKMCKDDPKKPKKFSSRKIMDAQKIRKQTEKR